MQKSPYAVSKRSHRGINQGDDNLAIAVMHLIQDEWRCRVAHAKRDIRLFMEKLIPPVSTSGSPREVTGSGFRRSFVLELTSTY